MATSTTLVSILCKPYHALHVRYLKPVHLLPCRVLLQITAMRYACLKHDTDISCGQDSSNWCTWEADKSSCQMYYYDADFVNFLLWSRTSFACEGSKLDEVVMCSFFVDADTCAAAGCAWSERQQCYPAWFISIVNNSKKLVEFKQKVCSSAT